jgi:hypothetical protein
MQLYKLTEEYAQAMAAMSDDGIDDQTIADTLEGLQGVIEDKAKAVAAYLQNIKAESVAMKEAEGRIAARRKAIDNKVARMQDYLRDEMTKANLPKLTTPEFCVTVGKPGKSVDIIDVELIDEEYLTTKITIMADKKSIKKALDAGQEVKGAQFIEGKPRLTIK